MLDSADLESNVNAMKEPYLSQFVELVREGAATRDIHDSTGRGHYDRAPVSRASDAFVSREIHRAAMHSRSLCPTLVDHIGTAARVLDVGCSTGGTTVALALSGLAAEEIIGIDANEQVLEAARVRALGHDLPPERVRFLHVHAGDPFGFASSSFDLVTCVSVLEFISTEEARRLFIAEILRVLRPGGHAFLATPNAFLPRELHSGLLFGNWMHRAGYPWSSSPASIRRMFVGCDLIPLASYRMRRNRFTQRLVWAAPVIQWTFPWQQFLVHKR